jgi:predicted ferric reductase
MIKGAGFIGAIFWAVDFLLRMILVCINKKYSKKCLVVKLPAEVIKIEFQKNDFKYKSGQYLFICIPKISCLEWHPFSISSCPH